MSVLSPQLEQKLSEGKTHTTVGNFPPHGLELSTHVRTMKQVWLNMCVRNFSAPCTSRAGYAQAALTILASANEPGCVIKMVSR